MQSDIFKIVQRVTRKTLVSLFQSNTGSKMLDLRQIDLISSVGLQLLKSSLLSFGSNLSSHWPFLTLGHSTLNNLYFEAFYLIIVFDWGLLCFHPCSTSLSLILIYTIFIRRTTKENFWLGGVVLKLPSMTL